MTKIEEPLEKGWLRNVMRDVQIEVAARKQAAEQIQQYASNSENGDSRQQFCLAGPVVGR